MVTISVGRGFSSRGRMKDNVLWEEGGSKKDERALHGFAQRCGNDPGVGLHDQITTCCNEGMPCRGENEAAGHRNGHFAMPSLRQTFLIAVAQMPCE